MPRLKGTCAGEKFHENSNGPLFFPPLVYLFSSTAVTCHLHQDLNQPRSFWQKGSYFTISRLVIVERHRKHTHSVPDGLRVLHRPVSRKRGHVARTISIYGRSEDPRETLNLSQLTLAWCLQSLVWLRNPNVERNERRARRYLINIIHCAITLFAAILERTSCLLHAVTHLLKTETFGSRCFRR